MIPFVSAAGRLLLVVYLLPYPPKREGEVEIELPTLHVAIQTRSQVPRYYMYTDCGFMTAAAWVVVMQKFRTIINPGLDNRATALLVDRATTHLSVEVMSDLLNDNIHVVPLPPKATHLIQPLDHVLFANYKAALAKMTRHVVFGAVPGKVNLSEAVVRASPSAERSSFTPTVICAAFRDTGIWPPSEPKMVSTLGEPNPQIISSPSSPEGVKEEQRQALMGFCASLLQQRTPPPTQRMRVRARKEVIYSPTEIIAASNALKAAKEHEISLKQARKAEREMRK